MCCTISVTTGVKQDTTKYYANPPPAMKDFTPADLEGEWYKVLGYNPKYDTYPCQINTFTKLPNGGLSNDILFRVPKPDGGGVCAHPSPSPSASASPSPSPKQAAAEETAHLEASLETLSPHPRLSPHPSPLPLYYEYQR